MPASDRDKWDAKYAQGDHATETVSRVVQRLDGFMPRMGRALEIAGGAGRHALWIAERGCQVTLADISPVALRLAAARAAARNLSLTTLAIDLEEEPFPDGPWDLVFSHHYLWRPLFGEFPRVLNPSGIVVVIQPTTRNLERHARPPAPFLLQEGELPKLLADFDLLYYEEQWNEETRHEAVAVARRRHAPP